MADDLLLLNSIAWANEIQFYRKYTSLVPIGTDKLTVSFISVVSFLKYDLLRVKLGS